MGTKQKPIFIFGFLSLKINPLHFSAPLAFAHPNLFLADLAKPDGRKWGSGNWLGSKSCDPGNTNRPVGVAWPRTASSASRGICYSLLPSAVVPDNRLSVLRAHGVKYHRWTALLVYQPAVAPAFRAAD